MMNWKNSLECNHWMPASWNRGGDQSSSTPICCHYADYFASIRCTFKGYSQVVGSVSQQSRVCVPCVLALVLFYIYSAWHPALDNHMKGEIFVLNFGSAASSWLLFVGWLPAVHTSTVHNAFASEAQFDLILSVHYSKQRPLRTEDILTVKRYLGVEWWFWCCCSLILILVLC